jgi:hypothetical protein
LGGRGARGTVGGDDHILGTRTLTDVDHRRVLAVLAYLRA